jgi:L-amino acid N-acyltransferase
MEIRDATHNDLAAMLAIYNDVVATSTAIYRDQPMKADEYAQWWRARVGQGYPVLVAIADDAVVGFASFGDFRAWPGYRFTVEHSVHVRADKRGSGVGSQLVRALIARATRMGKHVMIAGVDASNAASIRFHERLGFEAVAPLRQVGFKFGHWLDLILMQCILASDPDT